MEEPLSQFINFYAVRGKDEQEKNVLLAEEIKKDLLEKLPKIIEHFSAFEKWSVESLVQQYAHERHRFVKSASFYTKHAEKIQFEYRLEAGECLKYILQKKFFNIQCLWRAGRITLPGMDTTLDFHRWIDDLYNCPFLEPISRQEVDILIDYLQKHPHEADVGKHTYDWQDYPYLKLCYFEQEEIEPEEFYKTYVCVIINDNGIPPWYNYYDTFIGSGGLLGLPDIKFPKELYYRRLYTERRTNIAAEQAKKEGKPPASIPKAPHRKPTMGLDMNSDEAIAEFVELFEPRDIQKLYRCYCIVEKDEARYPAEDTSMDEDEPDEDGIMDTRDDEWEEEPRGPSKDDLDTAWYALREAREPVPMEAHADWRVALVEGYRKYKIRKIIEAIPAAYDDYLMRMETGIGFEKPEDTELPQYMQEAKENILKGRKLAGEPEDFNY
jgi:hypothetical protein